MRILLVSSILAAATFMSASCANSASKVNESEGAPAKVEKAEASPATNPAPKQEGVITLVPGDALPVSKDKPVVIDFFATWCGPCRSYAPIFDKVADEYAGKAVFVRVDVDQHNELAYKYGIQSIPTTIVIAPDGAVKKSVGLIDAQQLISLFSNYVNK